MVPLVKYNNPLGTQKTVLPDFDKVSADRETFKTDHIQLIVAAVA